MDTMMPMMPARLMVVPRVWPMMAMMAHSSGAGHHQAGQHHQAEQPVVEDHVEHHQEPARPGRR